ncbi:ATP-binding protein [Streptomyces sp. NPDC032940]|uniref:ATP-binding protein n=1 Tax=Streptomyces sp. NPDC032940 TaxID=3155366 RepID=UPI0034112B52
MVLTFGSLLAAGLPLLTAILGVGIGGLAIKVLAEPLGLAIAHALVTAHGGRIALDTAPGQGCTFRITPPVAGHLLQ